MRQKAKGIAAFLTATIAAVTLALFAGHALAQPAVDGGTPDAGVVTDTGAEEVTVDAIKEAIEKAIDDWETLGWIGGMAAVIGVLLLIMRFKPLDTFLEDKGIKWIKPYVAAGIGALGGFFSTFATGKSIWFSIVMGLIAGITSPGLHLILTKGNKK
jgi:hypothetical protein